MGLNDTFHFYNYISDDTTTYSIKMSDLDAGAGGFVQTAGTPTNIWPYKAKNLRHVLGLDAAGHRTRLPIGSNANSLYTTGGTFSLRGRTYQIEGIIGEKRKKNSVA